MVEKTKYLPLPVESPAISRADQLRYSPMIRLCLLAWTLTLALILPVAKAAQDEPNQPTEPVKSPRPLQISDVKLWKWVWEMKFSPDAKWCGYFLWSSEGDQTIIIREVVSEKKYTFTTGRDSSLIEFSHDSKWVAFQDSALEKEAKHAKKDKKPVPSKIVLIELKTGEKTEFEKADGFAFSGEAATWLAVWKMAPENRPTGKEGWSGRDLILHELATGKQFNMGNMGEYSFNKPGKWLALTIDAQDQSGNGVLLFDTTSSRLLVLDSDKAEYCRLSWTKEGDALALLKALKSEDYDDKLHQLLAYNDLDAEEPHCVHVDPAQDPGIPENMTISPDYTPIWTEKRDAILFGIHEPKKKEKSDDEGKKDQKEGKDKKDDDKIKQDKQSSSENDEEPDLILWNWNDKRLQSQQQVEEPQDKKFSYLCIHRVKEGKTLRLADEEIRSVTPLKPHRFAVGFDNSKYELMSTLDGRKYQDIYSIDLQTGKKKLLLKKIQWYDSAAPTGDQILYFRDGHYHVYNLITGEDRNITKDVPVSFIDVENDRNTRKDAPVAAIGWVKDGRSVILSDNWDMWLVPVSGGDAVNLTVNGKKDAIRFQGRYKLDPDEEGIDLSQAMYISAYGEWTKKSGIGRIAMGHPGVDMLLWDDASFESLNKVKDQDVYYYTRSTYCDYPNYFVAGPNLDNGKQVTDANPQQSQFLWCSGARLVDYHSKRNERLQAALFLPAGYIEGKSYPTIIYIYEKMSDWLHYYLFPSVGHFSPSIYTSQSYAVLMPDITYRVNHPGQSAVECVLPALEAAVATGVVDPNHVGLHGHSWGGYQTAFLITQTDKFQAAVADAAPTNPTSLYNLIYQATGTSHQWIWENEQGRMAGDLWTNVKAYMRNSTVFQAPKVNTPLLILQNDKDIYVNWSQGIELFNALRRLRKPVVMLEYLGEGHGLGKLANEKDYSYRMLEFFDHFLKGKEEPKWWKEGVKYLDREEYIKQYRKARSE
jgi:dipeptidyl aminopeptidase/acylaminoacyl peptidase